MSRRGSLIVPTSQADEDLRVYFRRHKRVGDLNKARLQVAKQSSQIVESKSLKDQIVEVIRDCGNRSSIHSFPSLSTKGVHPLVVLIWLVSLAASWSYLAYQIYTSLILFNAYTVATSVSVHYEVLYSFI